MTENRKPLSEELRDTRPYGLEGADPLWTRWAERAAALEVELKRVTGLYAHWYDSFLNENDKLVQLTDKLRAAEAERDKLSAQVKFLDVHAIREDGNGYTFERIAENARLAAEVNATRAYYANFSVVTDRIVENERLRVALEKREQLLIRIEPLDEESKLMKFHRTNELAQLRTMMENES